ncbi:MAG TPA: tRNA epoxyqueuosine(34) reductase QueG [Accumulibacter sp.]|nr:tRNA epoxyqueuosine(34) reductase QueG [Accumulibacter sp.]HMW17305.1 tRNA epoxyqueuosine(34) reductase QueG [Accumulibacter sp.]HMX23167.1 tRNA epoxyqueuosine(34) reductase QueG [Accumulibacter sp.]HMY06569.1 tRNA epoxyqueuosine(34) reductase QueG [Accumulibacter sp.]HNC17522.1 tRNA epoxyqueuosine(34) reductase QueG [Accumulibacter sp.]
MDDDQRVDDQPLDYRELTRKIKHWGRELGFASVGIADVDVTAAVPRLQRWLALERHGEMDYMAKHASLRASPECLLAGVRSVISVRLPYWPAAADAHAVLADRQRAYVSRYALGRDYHKTVRQRLKRLGECLAEEVTQKMTQKTAGKAVGEPLLWRGFADSAPVLETEFASRSGTAWRGKHALTLTRQGSWHFLGEIYCNLPLPADAPIAEHCGDCRRCIEVCPTQAIVAPYEVDARRCISYLTIELGGSIPPDLRRAIGNRIYGCDDCQLHCPWNRFATLGDADFAVRNGLDTAPLTTLFAWSDEQFQQRLTGSPIRRIGYLRWLRNLAVALGNAESSPGVQAALEARRHDPSPLVREHVAWALAEQDAKRIRPASAAPPQDGVTCSDSSDRRRPPEPPSGCSASDP